MECMVYTIPEVASALGVSRLTAYKLAKAGQIPTIRLGKRMVVPRVRLEQLLNGESKSVEKDGRNEGNLNTSE